MLLLITLAHAKWEIICGTEDMGRVYTLESVGSRLYAGAKYGAYISDDNGRTWRLTNAREDIVPFAISADAVYAARPDYGVTGSTKLIPGPSKPAKATSRAFAKYSSPVPARSSLSGTWTALSYRTTEVRHGTTRPTTGSGNQTIIFADHPSLDLK